MTRWQAYWLIWSGVSFVAFIRRMGRTYRAGRREVSKHYRLIWPRTYCYRVADDVTSRVGWNRYVGEKPIGVYVRIGRHSYCIRWARTRAKTFVFGLWR